MSESPRAEPSVISTPTDQATSSRASERPRRAAADYVGLLVVLALLLALFGSLSDHFLTRVTLVTLANQIPALAVIAIGMTFVLVIGGIDLSVGSVLALSSALLGSALTGWGWPLLAAVPLALGVGLLAGIANGIVTVGWGIPSFIVTLGMLEVARGGAYLVTGSQSVFIGSAIETIGSPVPGLGLSPAFLIAVLLVVAAQLVLSRTVFGRYMVAIGTNEEAVRLSGIDPRPVKLAVFAISGLLAGLGGVFGAAYLESADPNAGIGMELAAIAAVVIGGTSLMGGRGSVVNSFSGVLIIAVLQAGLAQVGASEPTKRVITGTVIVAAVIADVYRHRLTWRRRGSAAAVMLACVATTLSCARAPNPTDSVSRDGSWRVTGGDAGTTRHSSLGQITPENVARLQVAWVHRSGRPGTVQANPIVIDRTLYFPTGTQDLIALDAANGRERWRYRPAFDRIERPEFNHVNRGVAHWQGGPTDAARIFYVSGNLLNAVDAQSGTAVESFGRGGQVDLNVGHHRTPDRMGLTSSASPVVFENLVIVGTASWAAHANVSAYDARTGERRWIFNTIPHPGEFGYETFGDSTFWREGAGVNVWGGLSLDTRNGMVFFGTGQPKPDFYRPFNAGDHLFANSVVALNARTGARVWHYQTIHRDLWDTDVPAPPILSDLTVDGRRVPVAIQITKRGDTFIFHRLTGALISKVEERPVPPSALYGETASKTQPFVTWPEPFAKQEVTLEDATNRTPEARRRALERLRAADLARYAPPSERGIVYYGLHGGGQWGGAAYDPAREVLYVNANEIAWDIQMIDVNDPVRRARRGVHPGEQVYVKRGCVSCHGAARQGMENAPRLTGLRARYEPLALGALITRGRGAMPAFPSLAADELRALTSYLLDQSSGPARQSDEVLRPSYAVKGYDRFLDAEGYPATAPPWGTLNALDLRTGKLRWRQPFGTYPELVRKGIPPTGTENFGGPLVTRTGVLFIGATRDEKFRAFDAATGRLLWEVALPYGGYATPSTYEMDGRQYVVIAATGGGKLATPVGDVMIAFALP